MDEYVDDMQLSDRLRYGFAFEESEQYLDLQEDYIQSEFIFHLLKHICLGGSMCQFEEKLQPYLDQIKTLYKDLVTVGKDQDTNEIKVYSHAFKVLEVDDYSLYPTKYH